MAPELPALPSALLALHERARAQLTCGGSEAFVLVPLLGTLDQLEATLRRVRYLELARWPGGAAYVRDGLAQLVTVARSHALDAGLFLTLEESEALAALTRAEAA